MHTEAPQTLLIVDDHPLFRKGVIQLIHGRARIPLRRRGAQRQGGHRTRPQPAPDMILLDLNMKDMNGIEVLKTLKDDGLDSRIIMLTVSDQAEDLMAALQAGADGYLLKDMEPEDLMQQLAEAARGKITISESLTQLLVASLREKNSPHQPGRSGADRAGMPHSRTSGRRQEQQADRQGHGHRRGHGESARQASAEEAEPAVAGGSGGMGGPQPPPAGQVLTAGLIFWSLHLEWKRGQRRRSRSCP